MSERKIVKSKNTNIDTSKKKKEIPAVSLESQERLADILTDSPHLISLNGTEWEVRALRMGTQWLIAKKCIEVSKSDTDGFVDVIKHFSVNIPAVLDVLTLALLNDKHKIYTDGIESKGFSDLYYATRNTLEWECDVTQFAEILYEVLSMLSVDFFYQALDMLQIFRASVTERKRMRTKTLEPK